MGQEKTAGGMGRCEKEADSGPSDSWNLSAIYKENGPQVIWLIEFWCLMINTIIELISFLVFVFVVHRMQD
jgi:hypothetical protein